MELLTFGAEVSGVKRGEWVKLANGYVRAEYLRDTDPFAEMESLGVWRVTAYAWTGYVCANGEYPEEGRTIACNWLPFGTQVYIEGVGVREVMDRGPAWLGSEWCDLYLGDVWSCVTWGDQQREVWLYAETE